MILPAGLESDAGAVIQAQPFALGLLPRNIQSLLPPQVLYPLMIDPPPSALSKAATLPATIPASMARQPDNATLQGCFV